VTVIVNGQPRNIRAGTAVAVIVADLGAGSTGTAVALNGDVLRRSDWSRTTLTEGDRIEVLTAVAGG
jgi:sulfur carrier protein